MHIVVVPYCIGTENHYHLHMDPVTAKTPAPAADVQLPAIEAAPRAPGVPCLRSDALFGKTREILIEHRGCYYRLRLTHSNKLILTK